MGNVRPLLGVLNGNRANIALGIHIQQGIFVQIAGFSRFRIPELDIKCVGILKILDFHGSNLRFGRSRINWILREFHSVSAVLMMPVVFAVVL